MFALILLAACTAEPLSPEERRAMEMDTYCRDVAQQERSKHLAQREQVQVDAIGDDDPVWQEATEGGDLSRTFQAAYEKCMKENLPQ